MGDESPEPMDGMPDESDSSPSPHMARMRGLDASPGRKGARRQAADDQMPGFVLQFQLPYIPDSFCPQLSHTKLSMSILPKNVCALICASFSLYNWYIGFPLLIARVKIKIYSLNLFERLKSVFKSFHLLCSAGRAFCFLAATPVDHACLPGCCGMFGLHMHACPGRLLTRSFNAKSST